MTERVVAAWWARHVLTMLEEHRITLPEAVRALEDAAEFEELALTVEAEVRGR